MSTYILRRLGQAIPQLLIISVILFTLMQAFGDPVATLGARNPPKPEDKERLRRMLGLDQPPYIQYLTWYLCNDLQKIDMNGDGIHINFLPVVADQPREILDIGRLIQ